MHTKTQGKAVNSEESWSEMPAGIEGSPTEAEVATAYCQDKDTGTSSFGEYSLA